jgi:hypothetical protein
VAGTGGGGNGALSFNPSPLSIVLAHPIFGTGATGTAIVTVTNTAATGGPSVTISNVTVSSGTGSSGLTWFFSIGLLSGPDTCLNATLAPGGTCTVSVRFTNVTSATGVDRPGTLTFTDNATGSPQVVNLVGHVN